MAEDILMSSMDGALGAGAGAGAGAGVRVRRVYVHSHDHYGEHTHGDGSDVGHTHAEDDGAVESDEEDDGHGHGHGGHGHEHGPGGHGHAHSADEHGHAHAHGDSKDGDHGHAHAHGEGEGDGGAHGHGHADDGGGGHGHAHHHDDHDEDGGDHKEAGAAAGDDDDVKREEAPDVYAHGHSHSHGPHGHSHVSGGHGHAHFNSAVFRRFMALSWAQRRLMTIGFMALLVSSAVNTVLPLGMGLIIDSPDAATVWSALLPLSLVFVGGAVASVVRGTMFASAGEALVQDLRSRLFASIIVQDLGFFDKTRTGELINRLSADTTIIQTAATMTLATGLRFLCQVLGGIIVLFYLSWRLTLVMVIPLPLFGLAAWMYSRAVRALSARLQKSLAACTTVAEEAIGGVRHIRSFGREDAERERYNARVDGSYRLGRRMAALFGLFQGGAELAAYVSIALVIVYGSLLALDGQMSKGDLTAYLLYEIVVAHALGAFAGNFSDFMRAMGAAERVFELLDRTPALPITGGERLSAAELKGRITFDRVSFRYPSRPNSRVLRSLSLALEPGRVLALVGPSGGGKTTIASLILRFYDPTRGTVSLDGRPLPALDPRFLRDRIGYVSQEPVLFAMSIKDNIAFGLNDPPMDKIKQAAIAAQAHDFIDSLPLKYDTVVGERGVLLSGGQKQRIAIARALLKDPAILLLDEATSALDAENEAAVQAALRRLMAGRTVLVIAHRLSTVRAAHTVAVIAGGRVVERGTHEQLMKARGGQGLYARLVHRQMEADATLRLDDDSKHHDDHHDGGSGSGGGGAVRDPNPSPAPSSQAARADVALMEARAAKFIRAAGSSAAAAMAGGGGAGAAAAAATAGSASVMSTSAVGVGTGSAANPFGGR